MKTFSTFEFILAVITIIGLTIALCCLVNCTIDWLITVAKKWLEENDKKVVYTLPKVSLTIPNFNTHTPPAYCWQDKDESVSVLSQTNS